MSRLANALMQSGAGYGAGHNAPMVDVQFGGQMGYAPDLTEWVSSQAYVRKNIIPLVVEAPRGFAFLPNPEAWVAAMRALFELHPLSIDGLTNTLTVDTVTNPVGGAGQLMDDIVNVTEARSEVTFRFNEKYGMPIANFFQGWIRYLIMDPNIKAPLIATLGAPPTDMLADMYSATVCFIEPDPTLTRVVKSWLGTNMYPKTSGEITGRRDLTQAQDSPTYDIGFTGIFQFGLGVDAFAQRLLDGISLTGANPYLRPAFVQDIQADVLAARKGYQSNVEDLGNSAIRV